MRVLQIVHGSEAGGVKTLSEIIRDGLESRDVAVETAVMFPSPDAGFLAKLAGAWRMVRRILAGRDDAIIAYQPTASILTGFAGWIARCPRRIVHQTALPSEVKAPMRWLDRLLGTLGLYTANVTNSHATVAAFAYYPARYRRGMTMIEHGVSAPQPRHSRTATLARFGIPDDRCILLNTGRLTEQKNQGVLIRALAYVPSARLVIAGDGPLRAENAATAQRLGVTNRLHLLGDVTRDDIADLLAAADLFVFPSTWETFGLAAVEAVMAGLPIVASDLPVLREVLSCEGGAAADFVAPDDAAAWAHAISAARSDTAPAIAAAIAQRYSVARMIDAYAGLLGLPEKADRTQRHGGCVVSLESSVRPQPVLIQDRPLRRHASNE
jgi:glycosyltransferase involved in cell wall biosynthesis